MVVLFIDTCNRMLGVGLSINDKLVYKNLIWKYYTREL